MTIVVNVMLVKFNCLLDASEFVNIVLSVRDHICCDRMIITSTISNEINAHQNPSLHYVGNVVAASGLTLFELRY